MTEQNRPGAGDEQPRDLSAQDRGPGTGASDEDHVGGAGKGAARQEAGVDAPVGVPGDSDLADKPTVPITRSSILAGPDDEPTALLTPAAGGETQRLVPPPDDEPTRRLGPVDRGAQPSEKTAGEAAHPVHSAAGEGAGPVHNAADESASTVHSAVDDSAGPVHNTADEAASPVQKAADDGARPAQVADDAPSPEVVNAGRRRISSGSALIGVLLALFGFTLVVQLRSNNTDEGLASARQEDLVRILSDLEARDTRLQAEIAALEDSQRKLTSGVAGREAALTEAAERAEELGLLAGTLPGRGTGLEITMTGVKYSDVLNAVQELRGAGGEVMQIEGGGAPVRIVASTFFVDAAGGGIAVDGERLSAPYTLEVIGPPETMQTALNIPGGVVASVEGDGGSVRVERREVVEVTALRKATTLQYARPAS